jgi:hypothetical protein
MAYHPNQVGKSEPHGKPQRPSSFMSALELHGIDIHQQLFNSFLYTGSFQYKQEEINPVNPGFSLSVQHEFIHKQRSSIR